MTALELSRVFDELLDRAVYTLKVTNFITQSKKNTYTSYLYGFFVGTFHATIHAYI
jgi:hypothetical protein